MHLEVHRTPNAGVLNSTCSSTVVRGLLYGMCNLAVGKRLMFRGNFVELSDCFAFFFFNVWNQFVWNTKHKQDNIDEKGERYLLRINVYL